MAGYDMMTEQEFESLADGSWKYEIESLRMQVKRLNDKFNEFAKANMALIRTVLYIQGIAEKGEGRKILHDETPEIFILNYVKENK
jgi:hypothetical protein